MSEPVEAIVRRQLAQSIATMQAVFADPRIHETLARAAEATAESLCSAGKLLVAGNGGSAADAQHLVAEFVGRATLLPARRDGDDALLTVDGVTQRARAAWPSPASDHAAPSEWLAVLRPETLALAPADDVTAWRGEVVARRFAGAVIVCRVRLGAHVAELETDRRDVREGDHVGVRLVARTVALVCDEP